MPSNFDAPSHVLMREVAATGSWSDKLAGVREASVLSAADSACYMAKDKGRNRVQVYNKVRDYTDFQANL